MSKWVDWKVMIVAVLISVVLFIETRRMTEDVEPDLAECQQQVRSLQAEQEFARRAVEAATYSVEVAHAHGIICKRAYEACSVEDFVDEWQEGAGDPPPGIHGHD